jgi:hypothetical protein
MKIPLPSFTRIDTFSRCPRQYVHDVLSGPTPSNKAMERGTHLHNSLEAAANLWLERPEWAWDVCLNRIMDAPPEGVLSQPEIESYLDRALPVVKDLIPVVGGVEAWFDDVGPACGLPSLPIRGKIDLISETSLKTSEQSRPYDVCDGPAVIDYKTISGERRIKNSWEAKRSMQLKIYCLATGLDRAGFIYFPPKSEARATFVHFSEDDLAVAHKWLTLQLEAMLACWKRFTRDPLAQFGHQLEDDELADGDWTAWPLSHPDNILCSPKWCEHYSNCIGASSAERNA